MRHLFIINPKAEGIRGHVEEVIAGIEAFFESQPGIGYDIYTTRYSRDAVGYIKKYAASRRGLLRIYAVGGTGTLFEIVNGAIGLPSIQIASYPFGRCNSFVRYFGDDNLHRFQSLRSLVTSNTTPIDVIRCGNNYSAAFCSIGLEADTVLLGEHMMTKLALPGDIWYTGAAVYSVLKSPRAGQSYRAALDGADIGGNYYSILVANTPCYGSKMQAAVDAHPNDGLFDVYTVAHLPKLRALAAISKYTSGHYRRIPEIVRHFRGRALEVGADGIMCVMMDGEIFYDERIDFEIIPRALDFVCPAGIDVEKLPRIYGEREGEAL